ncbi:MAG TPA: carboxypeptidase regulatory-like domain-containing protein [Thermoanaerobaculia bacterium]|jgi:protocatechuate 3,4-dioxygenase beta subunit|nr:carboxypeptidase regulatory-like domain-containing protein [Thermoanaerobaculia bacterium]
MPVNALRAALRTVGKTLVPALLLAAGARAAVAMPVPIHGRVENERHQPLRDAVVRLYPLIGVRAAAELQLAGTYPPPQKAEAKADADGAFTIEAPGPGVWRVVASAPGRAELETLVRPLVEETWLPAATLVADAPLEVTVVDAAGKPVAGAAVVADVSDSRFMADWMPGQARLVTDAAGKAVVHRAAATRLDVTVTARGQATLQLKGVRGSGVRAALAAGTARELRVAGPDGKPVEGALVMALPAFAPLGKSDRAGKLTVASTGPTPLSLAVEDVAGASARISLEPPKGDARPAAAERTLDVRLERPLVLSGRVIDTESRQPLAGAVVYGQRPEAWAVSDAGGAYTLERLPPKRTGWISGAAVAHLPGFVDGSDASAGRAPTLALRPAAALVGSVVDPRGKPLAGVAVAAAPAPDMGGGMRFFRRMGMGSDRLQTKTDERGRYRLAPLPTDVPQQITFRHAGFATLEKLLPPAARDRLAELHVTLQPGARGVGRVASMQGTAIAGAKVSLDRQEEGGPGMRRMMRMPGERDEGKAEAESDAAGKFTIADLATGKFVLRVEAAGYAATTVPGIEVPANAGEVDLGTVKLAPGAVVEGRVVGPHGEPIEGAEVFALDGMMGMMPQVRWALMGKEADTTSAADGFFRLGDRAAGEKVNLAVRRAGYTVERLLGVVAPTEEPVTVTLRPSSAVRGRIVDVDGDPVADAMVRLSVERAGGGMAFSMISGNSGSGDDGRFTIEDVEPGTVRLTVTAAGYLPLERGGLEVPAGKDLEGLELVLHTGATVEGRVSAPDGGPAIGARVELVQEGEGSPFMPARMMGGGSAETDGDGHYRLEGVEPGARTLQAEHEDYDRGVASLDVKPGENHLDLRLGGGQTVSGRVTSSAGGPVAGATVSLGPPGQPWQADRSATTDEGGLFNVTGVPDGTYEATASHADYAEGRAAATITVAGAPVGGVTIELPAGAAVVGALHGLSLAELSRVRVMASSEQSFKQGAVSYDGRYRIAGLAPGEWNVVGRLDEGGRQARGRVTLATGESEATLDLDFEGGLALHGHVRQDGRPVDGAMVMLRGHDVVASGRGRTDYAGAYEVENLRPGNYDVEVFAPTTGMRKHDTVTLDADRELDFDLRSTRIAGKVLEAGTGEPLAGVAVKAEPAQPDDDGMAIFSGAVTTDDGGRFALGAATEGSWTVSAEKAGYARASTGIDVGAEPVDDLEIRLSPTQGITLMVSRTAGAPPRNVQVAVLDGARRALVTGMYSTGENGRVRLSTVPPGTWEVLVRADDSGTVRTIASSPGEPVPVTLAPQATLQVNVRDLAGEATRAVVTLIGGDGQPFVFPGWASVEDDFPLAYGRATIPYLPAGTWTVRAKAPDGRTWSGTATTVAGAATTVDLD